MTTSAPLEDLAGAPGEPGAGLAVVLVVEAGPAAGAAFEEHLPAARGQPGDDARDERHPPLAPRRLVSDADDHPLVPRLPPRADSRDPAGGRR